MPRWWYSSAAGGSIRADVIYNAARMSARAAARSRCAALLRGGKQYDEMFEAAARSLNDIGMNQQPQTPSGDGAHYHDYLPYSDIHILSMIFSALRGDARGARCARARAQRACAVRASKN